jgi:predicted alpha/beta superfamily hydrolase
MRLWRTIFVIALAPAARGQAVPANSPWLKESFQSTKLDEQRTIYIATPANYHSSGERYPVLVLLDAEDEPQFTAAVGNIAFLTNRGAIPSLLVVGVTNGKDRSHDMTPPATGESKKFRTAGGDSAFLGFILDEVVPRVRSQYRALPSTVLAGHSFGGLFALHVAATKPGAFNGIIAMSPSLWWNDSTVALEYANAIGKAAAPTRLLVTSGGLERGIAFTTRRFAARLDSIKPEGVAFAFRHYPDDSHRLTSVQSLMDGLRFVFAPVSLMTTPLQLLGRKPDLAEIVTLLALGPTVDSAAIVNAIARIEESYGRGARSLALRQEMPEWAMQNYGDVALQVLKVPSAAVWIFRRNVANYPDSPDVYVSLGDGLLATGDSAGARAQFRKARDLAVQLGQPAEATQKKLEGLESALRAGKIKP